MDHFTIAQSLDVAQRYEEAIAEYEKAMAQTDAPIDVYVNLAFIYWDAAAEFTWADEHQISGETRELGSYRCFHLIDLALQKFPNQVELLFWKKYMPHRLFFDSLTKEEVIAISSLNPDNLVPYFFLYLFDNDSYKLQKAKLLTICNELPTAKNLYIKSLLTARDY